MGLSAAGKKRHPNLATDRMYQAVELPELNLANERRESMKHINYVQGDKSTRPGTQIMFTSK